MRQCFEGLAATLVELARNPANDTPFTVMVRGGWGRGKTTLLRRTEELFGEAPKVGGERRVKTLWFNAWKYPSEETVLAGLLGQLVEGLQRGDLGEQLKVSAQRYKQSLAGVALKALVPWLPALEGEKRLEKADEKRAFHDTFRQLFSELLYVWHRGRAIAEDTQHRNVERWLEEHQKEHVLAIFLDDLDRCRHDRVVELLSAINLFLDLPGVCFYLGVDWGRLREILATTFPGREEAFLEKMVQVELELHEVSPEDAEGYVRHLLEDSDLSWLEVGDRSALSHALETRHPRHVKRVLNDLSLRLSVLRNLDKLGSGEQQLEQRAVVAWHLLREALPADEWTAIARSRGDLDGFLRRWRALSDAPDGAEPGKESGLPGRLLELRRGEVLVEHIELIGGLNAAQRDLLLHLGSPPAQARARERAVSHRLGQDLLELEGAAWVPLAGTFSRGSTERPDEQPVRQVTLSPYRIARYPTTNRQYAAFLEASSAKVYPGGWEDGRWPDGKDDHPVVGVSWNDARAFCAWLTGEIGIEGQWAELPSEAQWEFAARGQEGRCYPWGNRPEPTPEHANYGNNVGSTTRVGDYPAGATPEGIHDLAGNVLEWCRDWYAPRYPDADEIDPQGPLSGILRVVRGGSFLDDLDALRATSRFSFPSEHRFPSVGFRVVWLSPGG